MDVFETKVCPQCGQETFSDMPICYGCLHPFGTRPGEGAGTGLPAVVDLDEPDIDDAPEKKGDAVFEQGQLKLCISTGDARTTIAIPQVGLTIGRDASSDIVLKSRAVSKRHVRVVPLSSAVIVEDLGATNPALYKGREIRETAVVHVGECFDVCGAVFSVVA